MDEVDEIKRLLDEAEHRLNEAEGALEGRRLEDAQRHQGAARRQLLLDAHPRIVERLADNLENPTGIDRHLNERVGKLASREKKLREAIDAARRS